MNWLKEIEIARSSNQSNVFLIASNDKVRISEILTYEFVDAAGNQLFTSKYIYRPHVNMLSRITYEGGRMREEEEPMRGTPFGVLNSVLSKSGTMLVIETVIDAEQANRVKNWIQYWSRAGILFKYQNTVFVFTSDLSLFNPSLRRLCVEVVPPISTPEEREVTIRETWEVIRRSVLQKFAEHGYENPEERAREQFPGLFKDITPELPSLVLYSAGLTLHDVQTAIRKSFKVYGSLTSEPFRERRMKILQSFGLRLEEPKRGFESVGGYRYLKDWLNDWVKEPLKNPDEFRKYGLDIPRGIMLYGPPGTGKTWLSKALAKEVGLPFITLQASDFMSSLVGGTERNLRMLIEVIEALAPAIVFIDEAEALLTDRKSIVSTDSGVSQRMINSFLEWLGSEDRKAFVVAATNYVERVDPAFLRPGRIDTTALVLPPDVEARAEIVRIHNEVLKKRATKMAAEDYLKVAEATHMWTGADLMKLVEKAARVAKKEGAEAIGLEHFQKATKLFDVNVREREAVIKQYIESYERLENMDREFLDVARRFLARKYEGEEEFSLI